MALAALVLITATAAGAAEIRRNAVAPYRYRPPPATLDRVERGKAQLYRNQLDSQARGLEHDRARGKLELHDNRLRLDTHNELLRIDGLLDR